MALDPQNVDALLAQFFVIPPFGRFVEADAIVERMRAGARPGRWTDLRRLALPGRSDGFAKAPKRRSAPIALDALNPMSANLVALSRMADGARCGGRAGFRGPHGARARHELPGCEPAAGAGLPRGLGGGRPIAGSRGATPAARVSGRPGVHPGQARPHAGEHRRHPRRARSAFRQRRDASTSRGSCTRRISAWSRKPTGRPRPPASVRAEPQTTSWVRTATAPGCCSTPACPSCATIRASCPCARGSASSSSGWRRANGPTASDDVPYDFKAECEKVREIPIQEFGF